MSTGEMERQQAGVLSVSCAFDQLEMSDAQSEQANKNNQISLFNTSMVLCAMQHDDNWQIDFSILQRGNIKTFLSLTQ